MVALCFMQMKDELLVPFPIIIFLASGLLFGVFIGLPILAEGFFPKHKKDYQYFDLRRGWGFTVVGRGVMAF